MSLHWRLYWNLVCQQKRWVHQRLRESSKDAPNKGYVFSFEEFSQLLSARWNKELEVDFVTWIMKRFMAVSFLLGALRSEQFDRFRCGGLESIEWDRENKDDKGVQRPMATSCYKRVKPRNGALPNNPDESFQLTIACLCKNGHQPISGLYWFEPCWIEPAFLATCVS